MTAKEVSDGEQTAATKTKTHSSGAADLEKVTDFAEEKEIDTGNLNDAMAAIADRRKKHAEAKVEREKQLASVKVKKEDVELIMNEMEISRMQAERCLKEHNADLKAALSALVNS